MCPMCVAQSVERGTVKLESSNAIDNWNMVKGIIVVVIKLKNIYIQKSYTCPSQHNIKLLPRRV